MRMIRRFLVVLIPIFFTTLLWAAPSAGLRLRVFPPEVQVFANGDRIGYTPETDTIRDLQLPSGVASLSFGALGWEPMSLPIPQDARKGGVWSVKLEPAGTLVRFNTDFKVGTHPRNLVFSDDGKTLLVATRDGLQAFSLTGTLFSSTTQNGSFSDVLVLPNNKEAWGLRTDGTIVVLNLPDLTFKTKFSWGGTGNGTLTALSDGRVLVESWEQETLSFVDVATHVCSAAQALNDLPTSAVDLSPLPGRGFVVTRFNEGGLTWFDQQGRPTGQVTLGGNPRALAFTGNTLWVADMASGRLVGMDVRTRKTTMSIDAGPNPQNLELSPDGRTLAVALRGINNPADYTKPGPDYGRILFLDSKTGDLLGYVWGREQPMGLAWSPEGTYLAFTDFLSDDVEIYRISR